MEDDRIVSLYWQRDESAIQQTEQKYGKYLFNISFNILSDTEDSRESVNDTYLKAWNAMPPHRPERLAVFLGKITRQLSIDVLRRRGRKKRLPPEYTDSLSELEECVPDGNGMERRVELHLLAEAIGAYLKELSPQARVTFIGRYYFMDSVQEVASYYHMSESRVKSMLYRTRTGLKKYLEQEGFQV